MQIEYESCFWCEVQRKKRETKKSRKTKKIRKENLNLIKTSNVITTTVCKSLVNDVWINTSSIEIKEDENEEETIQKKKNYLKWTSKNKIKFLISFFYTYKRKINIKIEFYKCLYMYIDRRWHQKPSIVLIMSPNNGNLMIFGLLVAASIELVRI